MIKVLSSKLKKDGLLIVGNYSNNNPFRSWMELGVEWYLIYRSNNELLSMVNKMENFKITIEQEPLGIIKFLVLKKVQ